MFSSELGTMIQMIWQMMDDTLTFLTIVVILWLGFTFSLNFLMGDLYHDFQDIESSLLTLFMATVGELSFTAWTLEDEDTNYGPPLEDQTAKVYRFAVRMFIGIYVILAALIMLNILIAMMAVSSLSRCLCSFLSFDCPPFLYRKHLIDCMTKVRIVPFLCVFDWPRKPNNHRVTCRRPSM